MKAHRVELLQQHRVVNSIWFVGNDNISITDVPHDLHFLRQTENTNHSDLILNTNTICEFGNRDTVLADAAYGPSLTYATNDSNKFQDADGCCSQENTEVVNVSELVYCVGNKSQ